MHLLVRLLVTIHGRYTAGDKTIILQTAHIFAFIKMLYAIVFTHKMLKLYRLTILPYCYHSF